MSPSFVLGDSKAPSNVIVKSNDPQKAGSGSYMGMKGKKSYIKLNGQQYVIEGDSFTHLSGSQKVLESTLVNSRRHQ